MIVLEVITGKGTSRRCDAVCHDAKGKRCGCICGGRHHGIGTAAAEALTWEELNETRAQITLGEHEHVHLRFGA